MGVLASFRIKLGARYKLRTPCNFNTVLQDEISKVRTRRGDESNHPIPDPINAAHDENMFGLAMSGGGIRSATFNLGVLEAISRFRLLEKLDYISTVSGGGYIGGWLTAWIKRDGQERVQEILGSSAPPDITDDNVHDVVSVDPFPITHLRRYTNYLTPKVGLLSLDTFVLVATYMRNLGLNLLLIGATSTALIFLVRTLVKVFSKLEGEALSEMYMTAISVLYVIAGFVTAIQLNRPSLVPVNGNPSGDDDPKDGESSESDAEAEKKVEGQEKKEKDYTHLWIVLPIFLGSIMLAQLNVNTLPFEALIFALFIFYGLFWTFISLLVLWRHLRSPNTEFRFIIRFMTLGLILLVSVPTAILSTAISYGLLLLFSREGFLEYIPALGGPLVLCGVYAAVVMFIGLAGRALTEEQRQWLSRLGAWLILTSLLWALLFLIVQFGPKLLQMQPLFGLELFTLLLLAWPTISAAGAYSGHQLEAQKKAASIAKRVFMQATPYVFLVGLLLFNSHLAAYLLTPEELDINYSLLKDGVPALTDFSFCVALALTSGVLSWRFDINEFSMNNFYKTRLIRAYLGASNVPRHPDSFTDFDREDDFGLSELRFRKRTKTAKKDRYDGPIPIVNCALNLVGTRQLALQERKADSFCFTPYYFGFEHSSSEAKKITGPEKEVRHRAFREAAYRGVDSYKKEVSLGDSIAISGAAVSPNMGYRSTAGLAFLLTVFNIRLGSWLANPKFETKLNRLTPRFAFLALVDELFARTNEHTRYVYLSDGGHFENLGIYELVRRRCRYIVVSDAGADPSMAFADLSNAIRKIRTDFGIEIDIDVSDIEKGDEGLSKSHFAVGTIYYDRASRSEQPGFLIYIKASLIGKEPTDIVGFKKEHESFPHQTTADQWFTESQFSSYRVLGRHIATRVFEACGRANLDELTLEEFFSHLRRASYPASVRIQDRFTGHAAKLQGLLADLSKDSQLHFLDEQLFPDSYRFRHDKRDKKVEIWKDAEEFRKGFYFCSRLIQLMENVFIDLNLDREYAHPDNRGWMNLFNHWTSASMLRLTWAISASTYGARFQKFCEDHFEMTLGSIEATETELGDESLNNFAKRAFEAQLVTGRELSRIEAIEKKLDAHHLSIGSFWRFEIKIPVEHTSELTRDGKFRFPCGFALNDENNRLVFLRIRDHLRGLGLARRILYELTKKQETPIRMSAKARAIYEDIVRYPQRARYFEILMHSLRKMRLAKGLAPPDKEE